MPNTHSQFTLTPLHPPAGPIFPSSPSPACPPPLPYCPWDKSHPLRPHGHRNLHPTHAPRRQVPYRYSGAARVGTDTTRATPCRGGKGGQALEGALGSGQAPRREVDDPWRRGRKWRAARQARESRRARRQLWAAGGVAGGRRVGEVRVNTNAAIRARQPRPRTRPPLWSWPLRRVRRWNARGGRGFPNAFAGTSLRLPKTRSWPAAAVVEVAPIGRGCYL